MGRSEVSTSSAVPPSSSTSMPLSLSRPDISIGPDTADSSVAGTSRARFRDSVAGLAAGSVSVLVRPTPSSFSVDVEDEEAAASLAIASLLSSWHTMSARRSASRSWCNLLSSPRKDASLARSTASSSRRLFHVPSFGDQVGGLTTMVEAWLCVGDRNSLWLVHVAECCRRRDNNRRGHGRGHR